MEKHDEDGISQRKQENTRVYSMQIPSNNDRIDVCQKFFLNTLSVDERCIRTALSRCNEAGVPEADKRRFHSNHYSVADREELIIQHNKIVQNSLVSLCMQEGEI